jgi:hypothetical protein
VRQRERKAGAHLRCGHARRAGRVLFVVIIIIRRRGQPQQRQQASVQLRALWCGGGRGERNSGVFVHRGVTHRCRSPLPRAAPAGAVVLAGARRRAGAPGARGGGLWQYWCVLSHHRFTVNLSASGWQRPAGTPRPPALRAGVRAGLRPGRAARAPRLPR